MDFFKKSTPRERSVDDLILLRKFPEAEERIRAQLREHADPQLRVKLGDVLRQLGRGEDAISEYLSASDEFLNNGFTDRARAAAMRARKIAPQRTEIEARFERMERRKRLDMVRGQALEALRRTQDEDGVETRTSALQAQQAWDRLAAGDWIDQIPNRQLLRILRGMQVLRVADGKRLVAEGSLERVLYYICRGEVEVRRLGTKGSVTLRNYGPGDLLGERSLLDRAAWPVTLVAISDCHLLRLDLEGFEAGLLGNEDPRGLIEALRSQHNDDQILELVNRL